jgi:acyl-CoA thioesterase FadM
VSVARTVEFRVRYAETDQMGVVYYANYLVWCEVADRVHSRGWRELRGAGAARRRLAVAEATLRFTRRRATTTSSASRRR